MMSTETIAEVALDNGHAPKRTSICWSAIVLPVEQAYLGRG